MSVKKPCSGCSPFRPNPARAVESGRFVGNNCDFAGTLRGIYEDGSKKTMKGSIMKQVRFLAGIVLVLLLVGSFTAAQAQSQTEKNKQVAISFYNMIFNEHKVEEAFKLYSVPEYKQHNPYAATAAQAAINLLGPYMKQNPASKGEIKHVIAEGNLVAIHNHVTPEP